MPPQFRNETGIPFSRFAALLASTTLATNAKKKKKRKAGKKKAHIDAAAVIKVGTVDDQEKTGEQGKLIAGEWKLRRSL